MESPSNIYLVEDDRAVRDSLVWMLRHVDARINTYGHPSEIMGLQPALVPSCLIVDFHLPQIDGLQLLQKLRDNGWELPFVVISGRGDIPAVVNAMRLGAIDFLEKPISEQQLCPLIGKAIACDRDRLVVSDYHRCVAERLSSLTKRELDVLEGVIGGRLNKQIATHLGIKIKTVETHRANLTRKLKVDSVAQLVQMVMKHREFCKKSGVSQGYS